METPPVIKTYTVNEMMTFIECPLRWYIYSQEGKLVNEKEEKIKGLATFYFNRIMQSKERNTKTLVNKVEDEKYEFKNFKMIKKWIANLKKQFEKELLDVRCINLPFEIELIPEVNITGNVDIVRKTPYGMDIIVYDFISKINEDHLIYNPVYSIYSLGFRKHFNIEEDSVKVYNFPKSKLIDITRGKDLMTKQVEELKKYAKKLYNLEIIPRVSMRCKSCKARVICNKSDGKIKKQIEDERKENI